MLIAVLLLAATAPVPAPDNEAIRDAAQRSAPFWEGETSLILGGVLVLAAALFFWAFFIRQRPQTQRGSLVLERAHRDDKERTGSSGRRRRRKRRPEHPENLPRNPTLAEIGGLPPQRPDEPDPPADGESPQSPEPQR